MSSLAALNRFPANAGIQGEIAPSRSGLRLAPENGNTIEARNHG